jgi:hypothetical protein
MRFYALDTISGRCGAVFSMVFQSADLLIDESLRPALLQRPEYRMR